LKKKQNILFCFSGGKATGKELGMGHVYRCLNLAKCMKSNNLFFLVEDFGGVANVIRDAGFSQILKLPKNVNYTSDVHNSIEAIIQNNIGKVIVDKYKIKLNFIKKLKKHSKIIVISDLKRIDYPADLVINGFVGFKNKIVQNRYGVLSLIGPKYQILNNNFKTIKKTPKRFGLITTFGGYDEHGISNIVMKEIIMFKPNFKTKIILGPSTKNLRKLSLKERKYVKVKKKTKDMQKEISDSRFGLCAGGITSYEFASQNLPFGIICQEKHQLTTAREWEKKKVAVNLGLVGSRTHIKLNKILKAIVAEKILQKNSNKICDGKGAERVAKKILAL